MHICNVLFTLLLLPVVNCKELEWHPLVPEYMGEMLLFTILLSSGIIRQLLIKYNVPIVASGFVILVGFLWGALAYNNDVARFASKLVYADPFYFVYVYSPILIFSLTFNMDIAVFIKTLPQIMIIGGPVAFLTAISFGLMMRLAIGIRWTMEESILLGILCSPVYPLTIVHLLKYQTKRTKQIGVLLQGEALFGLCMCNVCFTLIVSHMRGVVVHWYQFVALTFRFVALGMLEGYFWGCIGQYLLRKTYTNNMTVFLLTFSYPLFAYSVSERYISGCGAISVAVIGLMMSTTKVSTVKEIHSFVDIMWNVIWYTVDVVMGALTAVFAITEYIDGITWSNCVLSVVFYLIYYTMRFICFILFSPAISRLGYGIDLKNTIVCVWGGIKCPYTLVLLKVFIVLKVQPERDRLFYFHMMALYFLSNIVNASVTRAVMDFLGLRVISMGRQLNMNHCLKHIFLMRKRTIAILKMDKFLTDVNWPMVIEATNMKHPYHIEMELEDDTPFWGYYYQSCPECKNEIRQEPTAKELKEMTREAKMRILKAKKMLYSRRFENGMVSHEGIRILSQAVEMAMDSEEAVIEIQGLEKRFKKESYISRCIRNRVTELDRNKAKYFRPPRKYIRRICYSIVLNKNWEKMMLIVVILNIGKIVADSYYHGWFLSKKHEIDDDPIVCYSLIVSQGIFAFIFFLEFYMKILAYSWLYIWKHGVCSYFRSLWNVKDFIVMIASYMAFTYDLYYIINKSKIPKGEIVRQIVCVAEWLRILRLLRLIEMSYPHLIRYLDRHIDMQLAVTFELGKSYVTGENEILEMIPHMIENEKIQKELKTQLENDKMVVFNLLSTVQKDKPWVAITVKTKQAIRTILKSMKDAINQLRIAGWVDDYELRKLKESITELYKSVNTIKTVALSAPKIIFSEVAWMGKDAKVINYLFENVLVKKFGPGDVVYDEGKFANGIYIVVTGLFTISYVPVEEILIALREYGQLPIIDHFSSIKFQVPSFEHVFSGNCIGEQSTLTERCYDCKVVAETHSQVYVLNKGVLKKGMEMDPNPVSGLKCRIWKEVAVRIALPVLMSVPAYHNLSNHQIKYILERAFVPDLSNYSSFTVTETVQDILLIEGKAFEYSTVEEFVGPCYIPRAVQMLVFDERFTKDKSVLIETKLLIIPAKEVDEYDIVMCPGRTAELVPVGSSVRCLLHATQQRTEKRKRIHIKKRETSKSESEKEMENLTLESDSVDEHVLNRGDNADKS